MTSELADRLLGPLFSTEAMARVFGDAARLQGMLDFEAALARAQARLGLAPAGAAEVIARHCRADRFDLAALGRAAAQAGNPAIPAIERLKELVAAEDPEAARHVHRGATSQDAMDTGLVLQIRAATAALQPDLAQLSSALARLARSHARTPMAGRTWLQHAVPVTFGLKVAGWLSSLARSRERLVEAERALRVLQLGGAAGTLAAFGDRGLDVAAALARELDLALPDLPWHAQRDRVAAMGAALGILVGTLGKIAADLALLMQTEIAEAFEPSGPGRGGSSTMPHKRNPVACAVTLQAAVRVPHLVATLLSAMPQEQERGLGGWHAEWETLPQIFLLASGALREMARAMEELTIDPERMRRNLDATAGLIMAEAVTMALGAQIGQSEARRLVEAACRRAVDGGMHLRDALKADAEVTAHLTPTRLDELLTPESYLGIAEQLVERALSAQGPAGEAETRKA